MGELKLLDNTSTHVVDILGNVRGRDQPIMLMIKALELIETVGSQTLAEDIVFFDPFCKGGEILLACAMARNKAVTKKGHLVEVQKIQKDMFTGNRYFALAPDERHFRLSLRTFLGNEKSHNEKYLEIIRNGNYLSEVDGKLNKKKFNKEFKDMLQYIKKKAGARKIIAVGNPPYQEADGGAKASAKPVYNYFVEAIMNSNEIDEYMLVIPSRWFSAGKGLESFREKMITCKQIKSITYFERAEDVFPTVHVQGGVCFVHWSREYKGKADFIAKGKTTKIDLAKFDIIPDDPFATPIIEKVINNNKGFISDNAWSRKPFGLATDHFKKNSSNDSASDAIKCYVKDKKIKLISRKKIKKNAEKIDSWKVAIPRAYATGARRCTLPAHQIFLIEKGAICSETYNVIDAFKSKEEALKLISYLQTDFARYLLGLRKLTQDIPKDRWDWVPKVDLSKNWTDEKLFNHFKLTKEEREHIKKKVMEW